jgi:hypothetical protein
MRVFLSKGDNDEEIVVEARLEGDGGMIGDMSQVVRPGDSFGSISFEELSELGSGEHELDL